MRAPGRERPARSGGPTPAGWARRLLIALALLLAVLMAIAFVQVQAIDVQALARHVPAHTAIMLQRAREARAAGRPVRVSQRWVPYARISPHLRRAVLIAEDDAFFSHNGFDWNEIRAAAQKNLAAGRIVRGGSTITQQLAKNLWLSSSRDPMRKFKEMLLAVRLERTLSKKRIFELYLNEIEWGDGVYGIEAAARHWYGTAAAALDPAQSVRLAAVIINPRRFSPVGPQRRIERRAHRIAARMRQRGELSADEYRAILGLPPSAPAPPIEPPSPSDSEGEPDADTLSPAVPA